MPITVTLDRIGASQRTGVSSNRLDHAIRPAKVEGTSNNNTAYQQAADAILAIPDILFHPNLTTLPLAAITVRKVGPSIMWATLEYYRRYISVPTQPAALIASFRDAYRSTKWYSQAADATGQPTFTNGLPSGPMKFINGLPGTDKNAIPQSWKFVQTGFRIIVPTVLGFNPLSQIEGRRNTINLNTVNFGNYSFPPNTVRFDGLNVDAVEVSGGVQFKIGYAFSTFKEGFYYQYVDYVAGAWTAFTRLAHQAIAWGNGFPVHA